MDNTIQALKNLYVALGGDADDVANYNIIPEMINAIASLITAGGISTLPVVSASDNGKVLTVSDGKWEAEAAPTELPAVTTDDNGKVLTVVTGAWNKAALPE